MSPRTPEALVEHLPGVWPAGFANGHAGLDALRRLAHATGVTPRVLVRVARERGTAAGCLRAIMDGHVGSHADRELLPLVDLDVDRERLAAAAGRFVAVGGPEYPARLLDLHDAPAWLFVRGRPLEELGVSVAVIGARRCSPYGREVAVSLGGGLAAADICVVSGAARGIDGAAHEGALAAKGPTLAVLGSGIDVPYPMRHRGLIDRIAATGWVVSEYPPGVPPRAHRFPARNRLIAGLASKGIVVVEGTRRSGSMITTEFTDDLGRQMFAVPGPVTSPLSEGPHQLLRSGAAVVERAEDVLAELGMDRLGGSTDEGSGGLPHTERLVAESLVGTPMTVEAVATRAGIAFSEALGALSALELRGLVLDVGGRYARRMPAPEKKDDSRTATHESGKRGASVES